MHKGILSLIDHFQRHGALPGKQRPLTAVQLAPRLNHIAARQALARQASRQPQAGWLSLHEPAWERFFTRNRCLVLEYGRLQPGQGRLLEIRIAPDGTTLMRVTRVEPAATFCQRKYLSP
ncbi:MAG: hypothetical protein U0931_10320 [Vulcanimicrobiota bacterium]